MRQTASHLRSLLRKRACREVREAADADLADLRRDPRWQSLISPAASGIATLDVDGYLAANDLRSLKGRLPSDACQQSCQRSHPRAP